MVEIIVIAAVLMFLGRLFSGSGNTRIQPYVPSKFIDCRDYVGGHPDIDHRIENVTATVSEGRIEFGRYNLELRCLHSILALDVLAVIDIQSITEIKSMSTRKIQREVAAGEVYFTPDCDVKKMKGWEKGFVKITWCRGEEEFQTLFFFENLAADSCAKDLRAAIKRSQS